MAAVAIVFIDVCEGAPGLPFRTNFGIAGGPGVSTCTGFLGMGCRRNGANRGFNIFGLSFG